MSKYMQIDIKIIPFYKEGFSKTFPRIYEFFKEVGYSKYVSEDKSLYEIVDIIENIAKDPGVKEDYREKLSPYCKKLVEIKKEAREMLLSRRLNELDKLLYRLEDVFADLNEDIRYW